MRSADDAARPGCLVTATLTATTATRRSKGSAGVGGRIRQQSPDHPTWKRRGRDVIDLAKSLGWPPQDLWSDFWFFTLTASYELGVSLEVAEDCAWRWLRASYDKLEWANLHDGWVH